MGGGGKATLSPLFFWGTGEQDGHVALWSVAFKGWVVPVFSTSSSSLAPGLKIQGFYSSTKASLRPNISFISLKAQFSHEDDDVSGGGTEQCASFQLCWDAAFAAGIEACAVLLGFFLVYVFLFLEVKIIASVPTVWQRCTLTLFVLLLLCWEEDFTICLLLKQAKGFFKKRGIHSNNFRNWLPQKQKGLLLIFVPVRAASRFEGAVGKISSWDASQYGKATLGFTGGMRVGVRSNGANSAKSLLPV